MLYIAQSNVCNAAAQTNNSNGRESIGRGVVTNLQKSSRQPQIASPRTPNPLATQRPQLLGHRHFDPSMTPPHCLEQHTNGTAKLT